MILTNSNRWWLDIKRYNYSVCEKANSTSQERPQTITLFQRDLEEIHVGDMNCQNMICLPMTPQATLPPALPVFRDSSLPPRPRSSVPCRTWVKNSILRSSNYKCTAWTTIARLTWNVNKALFYTNNRRSSPNNTCGSVKGDNRILDCELCFSSRIRWNVTQVSDMSNMVIGATVCLAKRIEVRAGGCTSVS